MGDKEDRDRQTDREIGRYMRRRKNRRDYKVGGRDTADPLHNLFKSSVRSMN